MSDNLVVVRVENEETRARIAIGFLQSNGIDARILEDDLGDQIPALEGTLGVKILVPEDQLKLARKLLEEQESQEPGEQEPDD